jgi:hypothetical protein
MPRFLAEFSVMRRITALLLPFLEFNINLGRLLAIQSPFDLLAKFKLEKMLVRFNLYGVQWRAREIFCHYRGIL